MGTTSRSSSDRIPSSFPCLLCSYLHSAPAHRTYTDLGAWWRDQAGCSPTQAVQTSRQHRHRSVNNILVTGSASDVSLPQPPRGHRCNREQQRMFPGRRLYADRLAAAGLQRLVDLQTFVPDRELG